MANLRQSVVLAQDSNIRTLASFALDIPRPSSKCGFDFETSLHVETSFFQKIRYPFVCILLFIAQFRVVPNVSTEAFQVWNLWIYGFASDLFQLFFSVRHLAWKLSSARPCRKTIILWKASKSLLCSFHRLCKVMIIFNMPFLVAVTNKFVMKQMALPNTHCLIVSLFVVCCSELCHMAWARSFG